MITVLTMIDSIESVGNCKDRRQENALIFFVVDLKCDIETELTTAICKNVKNKIFEIYTTDRHKT